MAATGNNVAGMAAAAIPAINDRRLIILKARRLADDHAEQDRAAAAAKTWLLAHIGKKRTTASDIADTAPAPFAPDRLAA